MTDQRCLTSPEELQNLLQKVAVQSIFAVIDAGAYGPSGAERKLAPIFSRYQFTCFDQFEPNPKSHDVQKGLKRFRQSAADVVIAIGGGTAIDIAKMIAACANETSTLEEIIQNKVTFQRDPIPLIAVPTTSGTGSEATQFAVVYLDGVKYSVDDPRLLPDWCLLHPPLTYSLPKSITAQTGLDAFCQAIESLWSVRSTESSVRDASEAAVLAFRHLQSATENSVPESRDALSRASHLAGRAINQSRTTACHAISYTLTSDYGIPHGHAVALTLGAMLEHNASVTDADCNDHRGSEYVRQRIREIYSILDCENAQEGRSVIDHWIRSLGCETRLSQLGITGDVALEQIASKINTERLNNNPRKLTRTQLIEMLRSIQ